MSNWWKSLLDKLSNGFCPTSISCRRDLQIIKTWCRCFCKKLSRNPLNVLSLGHFLNSSSCPAAYSSLRKAAVARMHFPLPRILKACRASYSFFFSLNLWVSIIFEIWTFMWLHSNPARNSRLFFQAGRWMSLVRRFVRSLLTCNGSTDTSWRPPAEIRFDIVYSE